MWNFYSFEESLLDLCEWRTDSCTCMLNLFVNPVLGGWSPADKLLLIEPQSNLLFGGLNSVRAMNDVAANLDAEVTTDGARQGISWVGSAQHLTAGLDHI